MAGSRGVYSKEFKEKVKVTLYLPWWVHDKLKEQPNHSRFVENCLVKFNNWKKPRKKNEK